MVEHYRHLANDAIRRIRSAETEYTFSKAKEWLDRPRHRQIMTGIWESYSYYSELSAYPELWNEIEREIAITERSMDKKVRGG